MRATVIHSAGDVENVPDAIVIQATDATRREKEDDITSTIA